MVVLIGDKIGVIKFNMHWLFSRAFLSVSPLQNERTFTNQLRCSFQLHYLLCSLSSALRKYYHSLITHQLFELNPQFNSLFSLIYCRLVTGKHNPYVLPEMYCIRPCQSRGVPH